MKHYSAILFDLDGTLLDTLDDLANAANATLAHFDYPLRTREEIRAFVGNGVGVLMEKALPEGHTAAQYEQALAWFRTYYAAHAQDSTHPYDGVEELLHTLHAHRTPFAIVSNKPEEAVCALNARYFGGMADFCAGDITTRRRKPAPDSVNAALDALGVCAEDAVYVGDSEVDVQTAQNASLDLIAVDWGFRSRTQLLAAGAQCIVHTPQELLARLGLIGFLSLRSE